MPSGSAGYGEHELNAFRILKHREFLKKRKHSAKTGRPYPVTRSTTQILEGRQSPGISKLRLADKAKARNKV